MILPATHLEFDCPHCKACNIDPHIIDGDTVSPHLPSSSSIAGGLARAWKGHAYHARLEIFSCCGCGNTAGIVKLSIVIDNDSISHDWANAYIWLNEEVPESAKFGTIELVHEGTRFKWPIEVISTDAGLFVTHHFGPYPLDSSEVIQTQAEKMLPLVTSEEMREAYRAFDERE